MSLQLGIGRFTDLYLVHKRRVLPDAVCRHLVIVSAQVDPDVVPAFCERHHARCACAAEGVEHGVALRAARLDTRLDQFRGIDGEVCIGERISVDFPNVALITCRACFVISTPLRIFRRSMPVSGVPVLSLCSPSLVPTEGLFLT